MFCCCVGSGPCGVEESNSFLLLQLSIFLLQAPVKFYIMGKNKKAALVR